MKNYSIIFIILIGLFSKCSKTGESYSDLNYTDLKICLTDTDSNLVTFIDRLDSVLYNSKPVGKSLYETLFLAIKERKVTQNIDELWASDYSYYEVYSPVTIGRIYKCFEAYPFVDRDLKIIHRLLLDPLIFESKGSINNELIITFNERFSNTYVQTFIINYLSLFYLTRFNQTPLTPKPINNLL